MLSVVVFTLSTLTQTQQHTHTHLHANIHFLPPFLCLSQFCVYKWKVAISLVTHDADQKATNMKRVSVLMSVS